MKITPDRLAVARAVRKETMHAFVWSRAIRTAEEMLESLPEPPDDSPATLPAPPGIGVCCMCDAKIPVACKGCLDYARESVGLPAPDVQAQPSHLDVGVCGNLPSQTPREIWESHRVPAPVQAQEERPTHACDHAAGYCVGFRGEPCNEPDNDEAAPDVQALDTRPPCNCPRDYAQYLGDDPHNRWCPRSRNPHPEVIQAQIDAARAEEREACAQVADGERVADCNERTALCIAIAAKIRARSGARGV